MLLRIYQRAERTGLNFNCPDVHQRIQVAFQKRVLGGRLTGEKSSDESDKKFFGTAEDRAKRLRTVWITDTQTRATIELLLKNAFAFRKNIIELCEIASDKEKTLEGIKAQATSIKRFLLPGDKVYSQDEFLTDFSNMLHDKERIVSLLQELSYIEIPIRARFLRLKQLKELLKQENSMAHPNLFQAYTQFIAERVHDFAMDPPMICEILIALDKNIEDCPQVIAQLILLLSKTHEFAFASEQVFSQINETLKNPATQSEVVLILLEVIGNIGSILDGVIEQSVEKAETDSQQIDTTVIPRMLTRSIREKCSGKQIKSAIRALQALARATKFCQNFAQPIIGQISNSANKDIKQGLQTAVYDEKFNEAWRLIGICYASVDEFNGHFTRIFEESILNTKREFKFPPSTWCAIIKCSERYLTSLSPDGNWSPIVPGLITFLSRFADVDNEAIKSAMAKLVIRISKNKALRNLVTKGVSRKASFVMVNMPEKLVKYLKEVRLSVQWIAVLVLIPTSADKTFVKDIEAICKLYRSCSTALRGDPMFHQPESSLPFIIDLLTQTFSLEDLNSSSNRLETLLEIRDRLRMIVAAFTNRRSYNCNPNDRDQISKNVAKSFGLMFGIADVCRNFLFCTDDLRLSRKYWVISELIKQEVISQSAQSGMAVDPYEFKILLRMFPRNIYKVLSVNGKLQNAEVGVKIPDELKYVPISPSKRKEKKEKKSPKLQAKAKKLSLADVEESSDDEIRPQSDDSESESDGDNDLQRTRSGRNVKKRVIEGTKKSEKIKERLSAENAQPAQRDDSMGERSTEEESEKENVTKNFQNITIRRKRPRLSTQSSTESKAARKSISKSKSPDKSKPANSRRSKTFGGSRASSKKSASDKNSEEPTSSKRTEKSGMSFPN